MGHCVTMVVPSMYCVPRWWMPCQWIEVPSASPKRFQTLTSISSFSQTYLQKKKEYQLFLSIVAIEQNFDIGLYIKQSAMRWYGFQMHALFWPHDSKNILYFAHYTPNVKGTKWAVFGGKRIHSMLYWKGSIVSAGIRTPDPWVAKRTIYHWATWLAHEWA